METNKTNLNAQAEEVQAAPEKKVNKKAIVGVAAVVAAIVVIVLVCFFVNKAASDKADEAIGIADLNIEMNDSIQLQNYMEAAKLGHKSGNRAKLEVAIALYNKKDYEGAIKYLDDASIDSDIIDAGKYALMGDCYVNLNQLDKALSCYNKAISVSNNNPQIVPFVLVKEANVYREQKNYEAEYKAYEKVYNNYPEYAQKLSFDIRKYAERARVLAGK